MYMYMYVVCTCVCMCVCPFVVLFCIMGFSLTFAPDRTFPDHRLFSRDGPGKSSLLHVLAVYSQYNPAVGYCQGNLATDLR